MTTIIKTILGFCVLLGICTFTEMAADWMAEYTPDWLWIPLFMAIPTGMLIWLWKRIIVCMTGISLAVRAMA